MCGIAGLHFSSRALPLEVQERVLRTMIGLQAHRGPDDEGAWHDQSGRCSLGHRRLSIIDTSSAGHQPMVDESERWVISFNGEIYNFQDLRSRLIAEDISFRTRTDTEVLLKALAFWGTGALARLDGMFAFAAFDRALGQIILARDPFGEKPLYYAELPNGGLAFASELQALEAVPGVDLEVNPDSMAELLMFQYIGAPRTIYSRIKKLPPGHWLVASAGQPPRIGRYYQFNPGAAGLDDRPLAELADELEELLLRSVRRRLIADVPLGAFLSGGVDSSTVCALVRRRLGLPLNTYSIGFAGWPESEHQTARRFAEHLGAQHHEKIVTPHASDFLYGIGKVLDEPNGDSSCLPTYLLSAFARESVTVAVSGDGGDEMFGGYNRYFETVDQAAGRAHWDVGEAYYSNRILVSLENHIAELFGEVPEGIAEHVQGLREGLNNNTTPLLCRLRKTDVENYLPGAVLPKVDRMSMQHSLEVRTPFLNTEVARFAERLPADAMYSGGKGKRVLREIAYRYLPRELIDLPKQGFALPISRWAEQELLGVAAKLLESEDSRLREALGSTAIERFMKRQRSANGFATYQVWAISVLESWLRHHPAKLARLPARETRRHTPSRHEGLIAVPMGHALWGVVEAVSLRGSAESRSHVVDRIRLVAWQAGLISGMERFDASILESAFSVDGKEITSHESIRAKLDGCTLVATSQRLADSFGNALLDTWRLAGVKQLVLPHPDDARGAFLHLLFNRVQVKGHFRSYSKLRRAAVASWWGFRAAKSHDGRLLRVGPLEAIAGPPETELSHHYALFRGRSQLPPLPMRHEQMARGRQERYSIWSKHCLFKPPGTRAAFQRYWLVPYASTASAFPMALEVLAPLDSAANDLAQELSNKVAQEKGPLPQILAPGDAVVVVTHSLQPGGAERQWCYLAIGLRRRGFDVRFVVLDSLHGDKGHYRPLLEDNGIVPDEIADYEFREALDGVPRDRPWFSLFQRQAEPYRTKLLQLTAYLSAVRPKAMFAQLDIVNVIAGAAAIIADTPRCVLSFRNFNPTHFSYLRQEMFAPYYRALVGSNRIALSGNAQLPNEDYAAWLGVPKSKVALIPNSVDMADLAAPDASQIARLRGELRITADTPLILGVFRLSEEKDPITFLEVCAAVARACPGLRVAIAGGGPLQEQMEATIEKLGLQGVVKLLGWRTDVPALMAIASLLLLTSTHEGMPNVAMEAQALGLPVVATRVGGTPEVVVDGATGWLRTPGDVSGLAEACLMILQDARLRQGMQQQSRNRMSEHFSRQQMVDRYLALVHDHCEVTGEMDAALKRESRVAS
jgi:asparagine synthase (glutamine-hydrolysing)